MYDPNLISFKKTDLSISDFSSFQKLMTDTLRDNQELQIKYSLPTEGIFSLTAHSALHHKLANNAMTLSRKGYFSKGDIASSTILGPRGIGKSTMLRSFASLIPLFAPNVIPLYLSYEDSVLRQFSLETIICSALEDIGIQVKSISIGSIVQELAKQDKYLFLIFDEMDKLYEFNPNYFYKWFPNFSPFVQTVSNLATIGNHPSGRFSTFLCGSSGLLMDLVTAKAKDNPELYDRFPSIPYSINMNSSKFCEFRIYYGSPLSSDTVSTILGTTDIKFIRLISFIAGSTARRILRIIQPRDKITSNDMHELIVHNNYTFSESKLKNDVISKVYNEIMEKLYLKNQKIIEPTLGAPGKELLNLICDYDWEANFKALDIEDQKEIYLNMSLSYDTFNAHLMELYDQDCLAFGISRDQIYPYSLWNLVYFKSNKDKQNIEKKIQILAKEINEKRSFHSHFFE